MSDTSSAGRAALAMDEVDSSKSSSGPWAPLISALVVAAVGGPPEECQSQMQAEAVPPPDRIPAAFRSMLANRAGIASGRSLSVTRAPNKAVEMPTIPVPEPSSRTTAPRRMPGGKEQGGVKCELVAMEVFRTDTYLANAKSLPGGQRALLQPPTP